VRGLLTSIIDTALDSGATFHQRINRECESPIDSDISGYRAEFGTDRLDCRSNTFPSHVSFQVTFLGPPRRPDRIVGFAAQYFQGYLSKPLRIILSELVRASATSTSPQVPERLACGNRSPSMLQAS
jgi:hypothetical protein